MPVQFRVDGLTAGTPGIQYSLRFENIEMGLPAANLFEAVTNNLAYLSNTNTALKQIQKTRLTTVDYWTQETPFSLVPNQPDGKTACYILEGRRWGVGDLTLVMRWYGTEIGKAPVRVGLRHIEWFYDIWRVEATGERWTVQVEQSATQTQAAGYPPETDEVMLFVHGWNMEPWEKRRWTEMVFKRLWWQGYRGRVALFDWPTLHGFGGSWWNITTNLRHFDNSEFIAWRSSDALATLMTNLNANGQLIVLAHSMGNVATGEALKKYSGQHKIKTYIAAQAAVSALYYDKTIVLREPARRFSGPETPEIMGRFPLGDAFSMPYLTGVLSNKVDKAFNYHNFDDWALDSWEVNNNFKPDRTMPYYFGYIGSINRYWEGDDIFYRGNVATGALSVTNEVQRHQIFAYIAESRSRALGQAREGVAGFTGWDLSISMGYSDDHYSHSKEFRSNVAAEWTFWEKVKNDCSGN